MEAHIAVIRPKQHVDTKDVQLNICRMYDIILVESRPVDKGKQRQLLRVTPHPDEVMCKAVLSHVYLCTGGEMGGLMGERAVQVTHNTSPNIPLNMTHNTTLNMTHNMSYTTHILHTSHKHLFCVPMRRSDVLPNNVKTYAFYSLESLVYNAKDSITLLSPDSTNFIKILLEWLAKVHNSVELTTCLFRSRSAKRLRACISNPAFYTNSTDSRSHSPDDNFDQSAQFSAHDALAKMLAVEKCEKVVLSPLFGSGLLFKNKLKDVAINVHWGKGIPDYSKITVSIKTTTSEVDNKTNWERDYPLHKSSYDGNVTSIKDLINKSYSPSQHDPDTWTPLHYAAWGGYADAVGLLLDSGCPPNVINTKGSTALHLAALCGHYSVVDRLLQHPDIDAMGVDRNHKTALDHCEAVPQYDWQQCVVHLKAATEKLQVYLMDGSERKLTKVSGKNTTVQQLNAQMMRHLSLPDKYSHVFTIWLCSSSLELQLKVEHEPLQKIKDWQGTCVKLTDSNSNAEEPLLMWRRDALLTADDENSVNHPVAVRLLFQEAYHNYIKALYPCSEKDVHMFAAILLYMTQGEFDQNKSKAFFDDTKNLQTLVPAHKLKKAGSTGITKIFQQYKVFSMLVADKDKSLQSLQLNFLRWCRNLTVYGSAFFNGSLALNNDKIQKVTKNQTLCLVAVNDIGVHLINAESRDMIQSFKYQSIRWQHIPERPILEIKSKASPRSTTFVRTKQAGLIDHLMTKMANIGKEAKAT